MIRRLLGAAVLAAFSFTAVSAYAADSGESTPSAGAAVGAPAVGDSFGDAMDLGSMQGRALAQPVVGMAASKSGRGYWLVARDGGIFSFGDARFMGSTGAMRLNQPIVGMAGTPSGNGYWFVAADGGVFSFGDARFAGSTGAIRLNQPIVGMASTPTGNGYWLVARDGGIFNFGDAKFHGSAGGIQLGQAVSGIASTPSGRGYRILVADGRVLTYGDASELPAAPAPAATPAVGIAGTPDGTGYWAAARTGAVRAFGAASQYGAADAGSAVVGVANTPTGRGYWLVTADGDVLTRVGAGVTGTFGFLSKDRNGQAMRYNPCRPIRYVVNPDGAPAGAVAEIDEAFRRLGRSTGLQFTSAGTTNETHQRIGSGTRRSYQPERYGQGQWAPILVSWTTESAEPVLNGSVLGYGGSTSYWHSSSDQAYVTGEVVFDRDLALVRSGFGNGLTRGNLVLHELGHVIGLDHVQDRSQVMYPSISEHSPDGYAGGDMAGLSQLGASSGCLRVASPTGGVMQ